MLYPKPVNVVCLVAFFSPFYRFENFDSWCLTCKFRVDRWCFNQNRCRFLCCDIRVCFISTHFIVCYWRGGIGMGWQRRATYPELAQQGAQSLCGSDVKLADAETHLRCCLCGALCLPTSSAGSRCADAASRP